MNALLGTMGFSYDDWSAGVFYPKGMKSGQWLAFYARHFDAVELDTTFYATPDVERVRRWAAAVPDGFRFCPKAPRSATHDLPLPGASDALRVFLDSVREMGEKLGAVLLQFPPQFTADHAGRLEALLDAARGHAPDVRLAVELRNRTWGTRRTLDLLRARRAALVAAEYLTRPARAIVTADFLYVRWIGEHDRFKAHTRELIDVSESLNWWRDELARVAPAVDVTYGFFNNDYAGYAIATCERFKAMIGQPLVPRPLAGADEPGLFG